MAKTYHVTLTEEERAELKMLVQSGRVAGYRIKHAQILLKLDETPENRKWTGAAIGEAYGVHPTTVSALARRFVENGLEAALGRKEQVKLKVPLRFSQKCRTKDKLIFITKSGYDYSFCVPALYVV